MNHDNKTDASSSSTTLPRPAAAFHPALVRQLVTMHYWERQQQQQDEQSKVAAQTTTLPTLTSEASELVGELLKTFVLEARNRAVMQAEIEQEGSLALLDNDDDNDHEQGTAAVQVRSDHCTKIAAEMLMDFS